MVPILTLWAPILVSAVLVFIVSAVIHMKLTYHENDYAKLPDEDATQDALHGLNIPPGDYLMPHPSGAANMQSEAFKAKVEKGPIGALTIYEPGAWTNMGPQLGMWFVYAVVVAVIAAYLGGATLGPGAEYLSVFRVTGTTAFCCYAMSLPLNSIWYHKSWPATLRSMFDGLVYSLLTAGAFGWLWPV